MFPCLLGNISVPMLIMATYLFKSIHNTIMTQSCEKSSESGFGHIQITTNNNGLVSGRHLLLINMDFVWA